MEAEIRIRKGTEREWVLAFDSFLEEYRSAPAAQGATRGVLAGLFGAYLMQWRYLVACEPDTPEEIMGFIVAPLTAGTVAWVQVKAQYRRKGVARALLAYVGAKPGKVLTPFLPGGALNAQLREKGYRLCHRPWMVP
jgi:GNAT superfamily N-acetyltransferase